MRFESKVALVTGGAAGIGEATVRELWREGACVMIVDRDEKGGAALARELGERTSHTTCDVTQVTQVEAAVGACVERFGKLDVLINNVGAPTLGAVESLSPEAWKQTFELDVHSIFYCSRAAAPHLKREKGAIVNIASVSGLGADRNMGAYNAAKAAVINLTRSWAIELGPQGVRVNVVCPGPTATRLTAPLFGMPKIKEAYAAACPLGRVAEPSEVAKAITFLASSDASFVNGACLVVDGGITAHTGQPDVQRLLMGG